MGHKFIGLKANGIRQFRLNAAEQPAIYRSMISKHEYQLKPYLEKHIHNP